MKNIALLPLQSVNTTTELREWTGLERFCVCDFHVENAENGDVRPYGIEYDGLLCIDHHAPLQEMQRYVSSGNLAIEYVKRHGHLQNYPIVINHTDCDSVISSGIMSGILEPHSRYGAAVVAADHTGVVHPIADLLQAISDLRDIDYSMDCLNVFEKGGTLDSRALHLIEKRNHERSVVENLVRSNAFLDYNGIAYAQTQQTLDGAFLPAALPNAQIIALGIPMSNGKWDNKLRLGLNAQGIALNELGLPTFGGRWNAGGTKRSGGTDIPISEYVKIVHAALQTYVAS